MLIIFIQALGALFFVLILFVIVQIINHNSIILNNRSNNSPFECGFDPNESARLPFSIRFFLLAIIFLIFDIEIALLFPLILSIQLTNFNTSLLAGTVFLFILIIGLFHEWNQGTLSWIN